MRQNSFNFPRSRPFTRRRVTPLGSEFIVILAVLLSVLFILSASLVFVNPEAGPLFRDSLNKLSAQQSGIVLLGENVDVDVDEPSVAVRWSVLGCGNGYILPGSPKLHGSTACGLPAIPLEVFLDGSDSAIFSYDPDKVPVSQKTSQHIIIQAQIQFDSDLDLDVHDSRLYPFDTYLVSTSFCATSSNSSMKDIPLSIIGMPVLKHMPSFTMISRDTDVSTIVDEDKLPGRHLEVQIKRPAHARIYAMLIFGTNWALCHFSLGIVFLSILQASQAGPNETLKQVAGATVILFVIPQLRNAMPDAPGLDGVLIDTIGYFPQMTLTGLAVVILFLIAVKRELDKAPEHINFLHHCRDRSIVLEQLHPDIRESEDERLSSKGQWVHGTQGHNRSTSMRDHMMEQVLRVVDAGTEALRNNLVEGSFGSGSTSRSQRKIA